MKGTAMNTQRTLIGMVGALILAFAPSAHAVEIVPITSFNPYTFFEDGVTAGIDFDVASGGVYYTQPGFLSVPAIFNIKDYNVTHNGITFDIKTTNANQSNQSRWRGDSNLALTGPLMNDFIQWYGIFATPNNAVEATFTLTGLTANTDYLVSFFTFNVGAGQTTHKFYDGASSAAPLITTFTTSGNQYNYSSWVTGLRLKINSGVSGQIVVTIQGTEWPKDVRYESRLTFDGMSVVGPPIPDGTLIFVK